MVGGGEIGIKSNPLAAGWATEKLIIIPQELLHKSGSYGSKVGLSIC